MSQDEVVSCYDSKADQSIWTHTKKAFFFSRPEVCIEDIAHGLSNSCRWSGQVKEFYSIAQHSVLVSRVILPRLALLGLLHDASEAYTGDISKPLKNLLGASFKDIESRIEAAVFEKYSLRPSEEDLKLLKAADLTVALAEARDLMDQNMTSPGIRPWSKHIEPWSAEEARGFFKTRFMELI